MYIIFTLLLFIGGMVLQTSVFHRIPIGGMKPDLVVVMVVYLGLVKGPETGSLSGFLFGLLHDTVSGASLGSNALSKTIIGFFCGIGGKRLYTHSMFSQFLCVGMSSVVNILLRLSIHGFTAGWQQALLYETLYTLICCPWIVLIFRQIEIRFGKQSSSLNF
jgi:rod shape-determining protein MreD